MVALFDVREFFKVAQLLSFPDQGVIVCLFLLRVGEKGGAVGKVFVVDKNSHMGKALQELSVSKIV